MDAIAGPQAAQETRQEEAIATAKALALQIGSTGFRRGYLLDLRYIFLGPRFVRDVLVAYEAWEGRETVPTKFKELMMVLEIELSKLYKEARPQTAETRKAPVFKDIKLK